MVWIQKRVPCLTMQQAGEVEQVCLLLDALSHLWLYSISTLGRNNLLILLANDKRNVRSKV